MEPHDPALPAKPPSSPLASSSSSLLKARPVATSEPNGPHTKNTARWRSRGGGDTGLCKCAGQTHTSAVLCLAIGLTLRVSQRGRREVASGLDPTYPECQHRRSRSRRGELRVVHPSKVSSSLSSLPPFPASATNGAVEPAKYVNRTATP